MPISSTTRLDTVGFMRQYHSTVDLSASASATYYKCASVNTTEKTWTGYAGSLTDGVWSFSASTTSLNYSVMAPVVGAVYLYDATLYIISQDICENSPRGLTSNSSNGWVISADQERGDGAAYHAFDDVSETAWVTGDYEYLPHWIQWRNLNSKIKIQRLFLDGSSTYFPTLITLQGSDDGTNWTDIAYRVSIPNSGLPLATLTFENNSEYYYHRLHVLANRNGGEGSQGYAELKRIQTYSI